MWPVKPVPDMTYNVFGGTLNLTQQQQKRPLANLCFCIKSGISSIIHSCFFVRDTRGSISPTSLTVWLSILNCLCAPLSAPLSSAILQRTSFLNSIHFSYLELVSFHAWSWFLSVLFFFNLICTDATTGTWSLLQSALGELFTYVITLQNLLFIVMKSIWFPVWLSGLSVSINVLDGVQSMC